MPYRRLNNRSTIVACTLLVVAASLHCPWEWKAALAQMNVAARHREARQALPVGTPIPGCENESGCICRGATLAVSVDVGSLHISTFGFWKAAVEQQPCGAATANTSAWSNRQFGDGMAAATPFSGRQLRALYASFLI